MVFMLGSISGPALDPGWPGRKRTPARPGRSALARGNSQAREKGRLIMKVGFCDHCGELKPLLFSSHWRKWSCCWLDRPAWFKRMLFRNKYPALVNHYLIVRRLELNRRNEEAHFRALWEGEKQAGLIPDPDYPSLPDPRTREYWGLD
jgi:hypothetical protein